MKTNNDIQGGLFKKGDTITLLGKKRIVEGFIECCIPDKVILRLRDGVEVIVTGRIN